MKADSKEDKGTVDNIASELDNKKECKICQLISKAVDYIKLVLKG